MAGAAKHPKKKKVVLCFLTLGTKMHKYIHIYTERPKAWETAFFPPPALERERGTEGAALKALLKLDQLFLFFFKFLSFFFGEHRPFLFR
jgi:hypothetical protein